MNWLEVTILALQFTGLVLTWITLRTLQKAVKDE